MALHNYAYHKQCNPNALHNNAYHKKLNSIALLIYFSLHNYAYQKKCNPYAMHYAYRNLLCLSKSMQSQCIAQLWSS